MVYNFLDKKSLGGAIKKESMQNEKLVKNYTYQLLENLRKQKYTHLLQTILRVLVLQICNWQVNLIKEFDFFLCIIDIYSKYAWVIPFKDEKRNYNY